MKKVLVVFLFIVNLVHGSLAQQDTVKQHILIADINVQIDGTDALNHLYNFEFEEAEKQFMEIKSDYNWHPLPYFLLGLSEWWKIMPNVNSTAHDDRFIAYMDSAIYVAERLYKNESYKIESAFFLAAAYGFKGRLYSTEERKQWRKAASAGRQALKYLEISKTRSELSPELMFGDALYNYFSVWIPENYPILKPILAFFPKGDKALGLEQLKEVSTNAFYTRTEAQVFLMMILNSYENNRPRALQIGEYLHETYPDNPYFHRYYARLLYSVGQYGKCMGVSEQIMQRIDSAWVGYEANSGRYAGFFLGQIYQARNDTIMAKQNYRKAIAFAEEIGAYESGYYLFSMLYLGRILKAEGRKEEANEFFKTIKKHAKRKHNAHKGAREAMRG